MPDIIQFVSENTLILVPALWALGAFLKSTPNVPNWVIPWVLLVVGISLAVALLGYGPDEIAMSIIQGILVTAVAVLGHQLLKQSTDQK